MANQLDNTTRPLYLDGAAFKALINRIGVLRESLREEMKHMTVEVDSSKFITKDIYDEHIKEFEEYKDWTNGKLQDIAEILEKMVTVKDVEEAYGVEPEYSDGHKYEIRTYGVYSFPTADYTVPTTTEEMEELIQGREPEQYYTFMYRDGEPIAMKVGYDDADNVYNYAYAPHIDGHNEDIFVTEKTPNNIESTYFFYVYKLEGVIPNISIGEYVFENDIPA